MEELTIMSQLDKLKQIQDEMSKSKKEFDERIYALIPDEERLKVISLEDHRAEMLEKYDFMKQDLINDIKANIIALGKTVKGKYITAVWNKGRETWNGKLLDGYAIAHPEVNACKKVE